MNPVEDSGDDMTGESPPAPELFLDMVQCPGGASAEKSRGTAKAKFDFFLKGAAGEVPERGDEVLRGAEKTQAEVRTRLKPRCGQEPSRGAKAKKNSKEFRYRR